MKSLIMYNHYNDKFNSSMRYSIEFKTKKIKKKKNNKHNANYPAISINIEPIKEQLSYIFL